MKLLAFAFLLLSSSVFAASAAPATTAVNIAYELKLDLSINGKHVASPKVSVKDGAIATVTESTDSGKIFIQVAAKEGVVQEHRGIMMSFVIGTISTDGTRNILAKPQIVAKENEMATITTGDEKDKTKNITLSVLATKKSL